MSKEELIPVEEKIRNITLQGMSETGLKNLEAFLNKQMKQDPQFREGLEKAIKAGTKREEERK